MQGYYKSTDTQVLCYDMLHYDESMDDKSKNNDNDSDIEINENQNNENNMNINKGNKNKRGGRGKRKVGITNSRAATITNKQLKAAEKVDKEEIP